MSFNSEFKPVTLDQLHREAAIRKTDGWRFIQTHAVNTDDGVDLYYSFMKDGLIENLCVKGVKGDQSVPSITDLFLAAFVFENEARELFGVDMRDIAIDFDGAMYAPAESEPMTFMTPEQKAAREKAKAAAAKKPEDGEAKQASDAPTAKSGFVMTPERQARLEAKLATMPPDKVAKVRAALEAKLAEAADAPAGKDEKPAAASATSAESSAIDAKPDEQPQALREADEQLEQLIGLMDEEKAAVVRKALNMKEGE